jgi:predicted MFS family arabinose efflux permease
LLKHAHWGGIFAMTLCVFVLIASEFMPVSLLTPLARDLGVTEGMAGQGIALSWCAGCPDQPFSFPACREYESQTVFFQA